MTACEGLIAILGDFPTRRRSVHSSGLHINLRSDPSLQDMEHGFKELVDRILSGELGFEMTKNADKCEFQCHILCFWTRPMLISGWG